MIHVFFLSHIKGGICPSKAAFHEVGGGVERVKMLEARGCEGERERSEVDVHLRGKKLIVSGSLYEPVGLDAKKSYMLNFNFTVNY